MKKFMFSAVALVAFSFAGIANTGGEVELELKETVKTDCFSYACGFMDALEMAWPETVPDETTYTIYLNNLIATCEGYSI